MTDELEKLIQKMRVDLDLAKEQAERCDIAMKIAAEKYLAAEDYLRILEIELAALERADKLRPTSHFTPPHQDVKPSNMVPLGSDHNKKKNRGRQPGSISMDWRRALADLVAAGNVPVDMDAFYLLTRGRLGIAETSVRERVRKYVNSGILNEADGKFSVTPAAILNLELRNLNPESNSASLASTSEAVN